MKCPLCKKEMEKKSLKVHLEKHIEEAYSEEVQAFHKTQKITALYKKLFNKEP